ncbi:MAG: flavin reductase family protein [Lentisphaeria bacterium]|jgi:flavin reductase (DIM6/NTAB) family NADH-FMN oxidoreductase RutF
MSADENRRREGRPATKKPAAPGGVPPRQQFGRPAPIRGRDSDDRRGGRRSRPEASDSVSSGQGKRLWKPSTMLAPTPVVLVSCGGRAEQPENIITVAWTGTVCSDPPMLSISIRPDRFSHGIITATREFVVNIPTQDLAKATDLCGMKSGRDTDKFALTGLSRTAGESVAAPLLVECPLNLECKVRKTVKLGSHDMFVAEIVAVHVSPALLDRRGKLCLEQAKLLAYAHREYYSLGKRIGFFGFSAKRPGAARRR